MLAPTQPRLAHCPAAAALARSPAGWGSAFPRRQPLQCLGRLSLGSRFIIGDSGSTPSDCCACNAVWHTQVQGTRERLIGTRVGSNVALGGPLPLSACCLMPITALDVQRCLCPLPGPCQHAEGGLAEGVPPRRSWVSSALGSRLSPAWRLPWGVPSSAVLHRAPSAVHLEGQGCTLVGQAADRSRQSRSGGAPRCPRRMPLCASCDPCRPQVNCMPYSCLWQLVIKPRDSLSKPCHLLSLSTASWRCVGAPQPDSRNPLPILSCSDGVQATCRACAQRAQHPEPHVSRGARRTRACGGDRKL